MPTFTKYLTQERFEILREIAISVVAATAISAFFSFHIDKALDQRTASRQFLQEFRQSFFDNPKYRNISIALEEQYLYNRGAILESNGGPFSDYELDDYFSLLYDIYRYRADGFASHALIDEGFGFYICITQQNQEVQGYRARLRAEGFSEINAFAFLDDFAKDVDVLGKNCRTIE